MTLELIFSLVALALVLTGTLLGWMHGGAAVLRYALVTLFATLVALRFWHVVFAFVARFLPVPQGYLAAALFIALFILGGGLIGALVNLKVAGFQNVFTNITDNVVGALLGLFTATLLSGVLLITTALILPGLGQTYDASKLLTRLDQWPPVVLRALESGIAGVPDVSPSRTPLPAWQGGAEDGKVVWR